VSGVRHDSQRHAGARGVAGRFGMLGKSLLMLRVLRGLSQAEVAQRAEIRPNQVSRYETGRVLPQLEQLARLLEALGIGEVDFFLFNARVAQLEAATAALDAAVEQGSAELVAIFRELHADQLEQAGATQAAMKRLLG
jgi:transcriptional regulator with XRE-family HTH domain